MAEDRIDSVVDRPAVQAEIDATKKEVADLIALIQSVKGSAIKVTESKNSGDYTKGAKELSKIMTDVEQQYKAVQSLLNQRFATEAKLGTIQSNYNKETVKNRVEIQKTNAELKAQAQVELAGTNTLEKVRALRAKIRLEVDKTNLNDGARIAQLNDRINKLTAIEKKFTDSQRQQALNVGNYQGSAKIIVEALERIRLKQQEVNKQFGEGSPEAAQVRKEFEALDKVVSNPQFLNVSAKLGDTNAELKFFTKQLNVLEDAGQKNSAIYKEVQKRLAQLTDQLGDTRAEIKALSSDSRGFDLFAGSVSFVADSFQTLAGAAVLFGASEEDAANATKNLTAIQSIANGVKGIATELTTKGTAANKAFAFVQSQVAIMTNAATTATQKFSAALKLTGIGLLITGFSVLISKLNIFGSSAEEAYDITTRLTEAFEAQRKALAGLASDLDYQSKLRLEKLKQSGASDKQLFSEELRRKKEHLEELQAAESEALKKRGDLEYRFQQYIKLTDGKITKKFLEEVKNASKVVNDEVAARIDAVKKQEQDIALFQEQFNTQQTEKGRDAAKKRLEDAAKNAKDLKTLLDAELQYKFDISALELQRTIDFNKEIADTESLKYDDRLEALVKYYAASKDLIVGNFELQKALGNKSALEIELLTQQTFDALLRLQLSFNKDRVRIFGDLSEAIKKDETKLQEDLAKIAEDGYKRWKETEDKKAADKKKNDEDEKKAAEDLAKRKIELEKSLATELTNLTFTFLTANIERRKNALQDELDQLEINKAREIELAGGNADAIAVIEARAQVQKETILRKQRELDIKKAQFDKAQAIARIIQETAVGIVSNLKTPILIPLIAAIGAAQLAAVIATPIPKYKDGGTHPGGPMIVGDGGRAEGIVFPDGTTMKTPARATLMDAPAGTVIHKDFNKMLFNSTMTKPVEYKAKAGTDTNLKVVSGLKAVEKAIGKIPQASFTVPSILKQRVRYGHSINEHLKRNLGK